MVEFDLPVAIGCDTDLLELNANLVSGATSLNVESCDLGMGLGREHLNEVQTTSAPATTVSIEVQYEPELTGQFTQPIEVVVTDDYGCISDQANEHPRPRAS